MSAAPPRPTLFPYTTLFRSRCGLEHWSWPCARISPRATVRPPSVRATSSSTLPTRSPPHHSAPLPPRRRARSSDRKSTRLNSSHPSISYAVFCLKKKNPTPTYINNDAPPCLSARSAPRFPPPCLPISPATVYQRTALILATPSAGLHSTDL